MPQTSSSLRRSIDARRRALASAVDSPTRLGQIVLGLIWCVDGLLKLQPFFLHHLVSGVIDPNAVGQPGIIGDPITWIAGVIKPHQEIFAVFSALGEIAIGVGLLVRRTVKPALLVSFAWALNVWLTGEGLNGLFTSTTPSPLSGIIGTTPMYVLAGLLVWPRGSTADGGEAHFGLLGEAGARIVWAALWLGSAALWLFPSNAGAKALGGAFTDAPAGAGWLTSLHSSAAHAVGGSGMTLTLVLAVVSAEIGLSVLWGRGTRVALLASIPLLLVFWFLGEGLGGLVTGEATDVGTVPPMILIAVLLLPLAARRQPAAARARVSLRPVDVK
jgi:hypothetical protein